VTGKEIYTKSVAFLMEKPYGDNAFWENALELINAGLQELVPVENSIRCAEGRECVSDIEISSLEEEISVSGRVLKILPLYLASHFFRDDLDDKNAELFYNRFTDAKARLTCAHFVEIADSYGGDADV